MIIILSQSDFFRKKNPTVISQSLSMLKSFPVEFKKQTLIAFSVGDVNSNSVFDATLFRVEALLIEITSLSDGSKNQSQTTLPLKFCEYDDYPEYFVSASLKGKLCIQNQSFYLEGFYDQPSLKYLTARLFLCENETSNGMCKSEKVMKSFLDERRFFIMTLQSATTELLDYEKPFRYQILTTYQALDFSLIKRYNVFLKNNQVNTQEGIFFSSTVTTNDMTFDYKEFDFLQRAANQPLFQFLIYASYNLQKNDRKYQSITELISLLVTSAHFLIVIFTILIKFNLKIYYIVSIINSLYGFRIVSSIQAKRNISFPAKSSNKKYSLPPSLPVFRLDHGKDNENKKKNKNLNKNQMIIKSNPISNENFIPESDTICLSKNEKENNENLFFDNEKVFAHTDRSPIKLIKLCSKTQNRRVDKLRQIEGNDSFMLEKFSNEEARNDNEIVSSVAKRKKRSLVHTLILNFEDIKEKFLNVLKQGSKKFKKEEKYVLKLNLLEFFMIKIKEKFHLFKKIEEKAYLEAEKVYLKEMDINNILKRIHEVEKLKILLLNQDQINIFDNLSRRLLYISKSEESKDSKKNTNCLQGENCGFSQLEESLKNIFKNKEDNDINKKLLLMIKKRFYDNDLPCPMENW